MIAIVRVPPSRITSPANPRIKAAVRLRDRGERESTGLTLVDGGRELLRALDAGIPVREAFVCAELIRAGDVAEAIERLRQAGVVLLDVSPPVFAKVAFGGRAEGVVAVVEIPSADLSAVHLPTDPLILVVEGVEKPGNLGAILRSADGAGADAVVAASSRTDLFNPNTVRASLGTIFAVPIAAASTEKVLAWLRVHDIRILAARPDAGRLATEVDLTGPIAIAVGAEADGLGGGWNAPDVLAVRIPMLGVADSLNVASASAVLLYEARRQRGVDAPSGGRR
jgi:TrmH family RNA methyltransferase